MQLGELEKYSRFSTRYNPDDSLGVRLVTNQPLPIRMVLGSVMLMIQPIPLWDYFTIDRLDYHWIKGYNGIYQVFVLPLVFVAGLMTLRMFRRDREEALTFMFLIMYFLINLMGVVVTSLEQRHFGQFLVAALILATLPDTRETSTQIELRKISNCWVLGLMFIHLAWAVFKLV